MTWLSELDESILLNHIIGDFNTRRIKVAPKEMPIQSHNNLWYPSTANKISNISPRVMAWHSHNRTSYSYAFSLSLHPHSLTLSSTLHHHATSRRSHSLTLLPLHHLFRQTLFSTKITPHPRLPKAQEPLPKPPLIHPNPHKTLPWIQRENPLPWGNGRWCRQSTVSKPWPPHCHHGVHPLHHHLPPLQRPPRKGPTQTLWHVPQDSNFWHQNWSQPSFWFHLEWT